MEEEEEEEEDIEQPWEHPVVSNSAETDIASSIDGNMELTSSTDPLVSRPTINKIKLNISKPVINNTTSTSNANNDAVNNNNNNNEDDGERKKRGETHVDDVFLLVFSAYLYRLIKMFG